MVAESLPPGERNSTLAMRSWLALRTTNNKPPSGRMTTAPRLSP